MFVSEKFFYKKAEGEADDSLSKKRCFIDKGLICFMQKLIITLTNTSEVGNVRSCD